jgi:DnaJ-like protein
MPAYFVLGFMAMVALVYGLRWAAQINPANLARLIKYSAVAVALIGVGLMLVVGRLGLLLTIAGPLYLLWRRWRSSRAAADIGSRRGRSSGIETVYLSVTLDHDSGTVDGRVKTGKFRDRPLADLSLAELVDLLAEIRASDPEGVAVLEAYIDRIHGSSWRAGEAGDASQRANGPPSSGVMTREEAFEVLGLTPDATVAEIREAHHRLMMKVHPDHGGSSYLAARLNQARDRLLGG